MTIKYVSLACRIAMAALVLVTGCGSPPSDEPSAAKVGCEAPEHEGLLCHLDGAEQVGVCTSGKCEAIPCEVADDCDDRSGNNACRSYSCNNGKCERENLSEGFACSKASGETGTCVSGDCVP